MLLLVALILDYLCKELLHIYKTCVVIKRRAIFKPANMLVVSSKALGQCYQVIESIARKLSNSFD